MKQRATYRSPGLIDSLRNRNMHTQPLSRKQERGATELDDAGLNGQSGPKTSSNLSEGASGTTERFLQSTIDALSAHVAILDEKGVIIAANEGWRRFDKGDLFICPGQRIGANYLESCEQADDESNSNGIAVAEGIRAIIGGRRPDFRTVYCCSSSHGERWFQLRATRFYDQGMRLVMVHEDITEIKHAEAELREITEHLLQLQDEERRRIARDLHDVTAQNIFAMTMNLARLRKILPELGDRAEELLSETTTLAEESLQEIRTVSYVLHPPTLHGGGLVAALEAYIEGFVKRTGIEVTLGAESRNIELPAEVQTALFRIVQESLANIIRHSKSRTARISLTENGRDMLLQVEDDGVGISSEILDEASGQIKSLGVGIPGMRTRLRQLGGKLRIESGERGTTITASVPIREGKYDPNNVR
ncbi:MAG TPA: histidine kinase [Blastocatellia bacterium]|nr:histidine kinase [Blastocatellia bacterium]